MTVAIAIGWISVVLDLLAGVALLVLAGDAEVSSSLGVTESTARTLGITFFVVAAVLALVVYLLSRGSTVARMLVTIVMLARIGFAIWAIIELGSHQLAEAVLSIAIAVTAIALLWNDKANSFFAANKP